MCLKVPPNVAFEDPDAHFKNTLIEAASVGVFEDTAVASIGVFEDLKLPSK